jgi:PST family polysaccharide transporter
MNINFFIKFSFTTENKKVIENIVSLFFLQGANYILPLLTIPYLVRVLGPDYFGLLAFATATIMYFVLLSDYGFNLSATRQVSIHRDNPDKISEIFSSVMIVKLFLMLFSFIILIFLVTLVDKFNEHWEIYILSFGVVVGQVLFPVWLFQGMEMMKYVTYLNIFSKSLFTFLILIFVNDKSDIILVPLFTALGSIVGGLWSLHLVINKMRYKLFWISFDSIKFQLRDGWHVFFSSMAISLYTVSTIFILGLLSNNAAVGQFAAADKIVQAIKSIYQSISQAVYPMISKKFHNDKISALVFVKKFTKLIFLLMSLFSILLYIYSDLIVSLILGNQFSQASFLLKIMSPLPLVIALSNIIGIQTMLNLGLKSAFSKILTVAALLGIMLNFILTFLFQEQGTVYAILIIELFVTIVMFFYLRFYLKGGFKDEVQLLNK